MNIIKDAECTKDTPVVHGYINVPVYGKGKRIAPNIASKTGTEYEKSVLLETLLPLEDYDLIVILFSGGKDSMAAYYKICELGVPKEKIELWHHDIDGGHPSRRMDWPVTQAYVKAFAQAEDVKLRTSWRVNGFFGELYRIGASYPVEYEDGKEIKTCPLSNKQQRSEELRLQMLEDLQYDETELAKFGYRKKFPAKSGDLARRWCSAYLKIDVANMVIRNLKSLQELGAKRLKFPAKSSAHHGRWCSGALKASVQDSVTADMEETRQEAKILIVSGERRGESVGRSKYNEIEIHRTNATVKSKRLVHQWRAVIDYSERDVWEIIKRHHVMPHPCYSCGWSRCSCMMCIFSLPRHWAGIRELFPLDFAAICKDEVKLGFTVDNKKSLTEFIGNAKSCVYQGDKMAMHQLLSGEFSKEEIICQGKWEYPAGAFGGSEGGPC